MLDIIEEEENESRTRNEILASKIAKELENKEKRQMIVSYRKATDDSSSKNHNVN